MFLVYTHKITSRCVYTFHLIFKDILGVDVELTTDEEYFKTSRHPKLNYSNHPFGDELYVQPKHLLFETGLRDQEIYIHEWKGVKIFFETGPRSLLPFDIFAASFYLVSRYEEYLPHIRDKYDRFDAKSSLAYKHDFLTRPVVNIWTQHFKNLLQQHYPDYNFPIKHYQYISTIDIDNAYAYKEKGPMRTLGSYMGDLVKGNFSKIGERTRVLFAGAHDPYDTYDLLLSIQRKYNLKPIYFFLIGDYAEHDRNLPIESIRFQSLIKNIADYADVGIHPSYDSNINKGQLSIEVKRLSGILNRDITKSRQHFLKLTLPDTYRNLVELDITDDYSMGYANYIGFRAGICTPFNFYDLDFEVETKLKVHPFAVMEATLKYYMKLDPEEAIPAVKPLIDDVKAVNGTFMSLWHNETLSNDKIWFGWRNIYEELVEYAT